MLACLLKGLGKVDQEDVPVPKLGHGEVLVRFGAGGICGTDLEKIHGGYGPGGILGHEVSGTVEQVDDSVHDLAPGDRVAPHHHVPCYTCYLCQRGDYTMCDSFKKTNFDPCGFAECFRVPEFNVVRGAITKIPDSVSFEEAALLEPTACCIRGLKTASTQSGDSVLIIGLGPVGLTQLQLLKHMGAGPLFGSDIQESRLDAARKMGAHLALNASIEDIAARVKEETREGVDLGIVSTGNPKALSQAVSAVRKGGRILLFGAASHGSVFPLEVGRFFTQQQSILTSYSCTEAEIQASLRLVAQRKLDLTSLITHRFQLKEALTAFDFARSSSEAVKTMIVG